MPARVKGPTDHVLIVGAGLAGLSAGQDLQGQVEKSQSLNVKVFPAVATDS